MNCWIGTGRLTKDPEIRYTQDQKPIAKFTLAVNRWGDGADFIPCVGFGKLAEHIEKYYKKGMKADVKGRINTGSYKDKDGKTVYTTEIVLDEVEFGESKGKKPEEGFMDVPEDDSELPFN